jgi:hypothetical protein
MGLSRRFLNLIVESHEPATKSLRRIDLEIEPATLFSTASANSATNNKDGGHPGPASRPDVEVRSPQL